MLALLCGRSPRGGENFSFLFLSFLMYCAVTTLAWAASENDPGTRVWKTASELSSEERAQVDPRTDTPRHPRFSYLPAEPYPFMPPYTAEEMGYRMMEFTQRPRWSCALANLFGSISSEGALLGLGRAVNLIAYPGEEGAGLELAKKPGEEVYRQLTQQLFPPESYTSQILVIRYRTDQQFVKKEDMFSYSPTLRRVRHQNSMRRNDQFPQMAMTLDDASGRSAWEYRWTLLGTDVLFETVRFPVTRPRVTITESDGTYRERETKDLKLMGDDYAHYTPGNGVRCYSKPARARTGSPTIMPRGCCSGWSRTPSFRCAPKPMIEKGSSVALKCDSPKWCTRRWENAGIVHSFRSIGMSLRIFSPTTFVMACDSCSGRRSI